MKKPIFIVFLIFLLLIVPACAENNDEVGEDEKIEAFIAKTMGDEVGAYKAINSQIIMQGSGDLRRVEARKIEDYYSKDREYTKTILTHSTTEDGDVTKESDEPLTSMIPEDFTYKQDTLFPVGSELSGEEKVELKKHILNEFKERF
ncbi:hypothetical protein H0266_14750 [Halobacillus locisalis]|uniref:Uncharacterized protein n=1 Tax=Halobacillus locisalis TaxID=220753 RepID=A0A838CW55_9BACI|nr:hypothetical protein [Halobacillus locisalis]MBA2176153.1 hypothetical protein [Halobacillus locisalis]